MRICDFIVEEQARVKAFRNAWMDAHGRAPKYFPLAMDAGEWDEALSMWNGEPFETDGLETDD